MDETHLERIAAAAWPAGHTETTGGWLLRRTPGVPKRRSNSALPPAAADDPARHLDAVEAYYRAHDQPVTIQVTPAERQSALDATLAARGYRHEAPTLVWTAPAAEVIAAVPPAPVQLADRATAAWLAAYRLLNDGQDATTAVLTRIPSPAAFATVTLDGRPAAIGLFVAGPGWVGVFCMQTAGRYRRRGLALAVLGAGARWAASAGAGNLYLQVEEDNGPARKLYAKVGFSHSHSYHYRIAPPAYTQR
jgi:GNAT superfamily N-acetyltransferase